MVRFLKKIGSRRYTKAHAKTQTPAERNRGALPVFSPRFRTVFYTSGYISSYTGFLLLFFFAKPAEFYPLMKQVLIKSHILSVVLWLFSCGMLFSIHVIPQLRAGIAAGRRSGIVLIVMLVLMSFSGYAIQIMPAQSWIDASRYAHLLTGVAFTLLFGAHLLLVRPRLRIALASATLASCLIAAPFFFLKIENSFPDEIRLKPLSAAESEIKKN